MMTLAKGPSFDLFDQIPNGEDAFKCLRYIYVGSQVVVVKFLLQHKSKLIERVYVEVAKFRLPLFASRCLRCYLINERKHAIEKQTAIT